MVCRIQGWEGMQVLGSHNMVSMLHDPEPLTRNEAVEAAALKGGQLFNAGGQHQAVESAKIQGWRLQVHMLGGA